MGRYREHPARCRLRRKLPLVFTVLLPPAVPPPGLFLNVHSIQQVPFNVQVSERRVNLNLEASVDFMFSWSGRRPSHF